MPANIQRQLNRYHHQNSARQARPLNTAYFRKQLLIASPIVWTFPFTSFSFRWESFRPFTEKFLSCVPHLTHTAAFGSGCAPHVGQNASPSFLRTPQWVQTAAVSDISCPQLRQYITLKFAPHGPDAGCSKRKCGTAIYVLIKGLEIQK